MFSLNGFEQMIDKSTIYWLENPYNTELNCVVNLYIKQNTESSLKSLLKSLHVYFMYIHNADHVLCY